MVEASASARKQRIKAIALLVAEVVAGIAFVAYLLHLTGHL